MAKRNTKTCLRKGRNGIENILIQLKHIPEKGIAKTENAIKIKGTIK